MGLILVIVISRPQNCVHPLCTFLGMNFVVQFDTTYQRTPHCITDQLAAMLCVACVCLRRYVSRMEHHKERDSTPFLRLCVCVCENSQKYIYRAALMICMMTSNYRCMICSWQVRACNLSCRDINCRFDNDQHKGECQQYERNS